ncbi:MAG: alanine--tRNA ligase, partial [Clostridiales bacterium]|nr:alanine--tRNA ligase [Clostridiales bacterium]
MRHLGLNEIREKYLAFFESKNHIRLRSASLTPRNDNSLLLINSGMAPLKPYFTGLETPPGKRVTTCQKCIRTGDIENVGKTARHGTFFEMLGNFSFGDYFKREAIAWAWEFVTKELEMPEEKLYISVYQDDDEAFGVWSEDIGVDADRIYRMGKDDNFWEHGLGPCGPCSEIYYDRGERYGCGRRGCAPGCDCDRYMEFWNLVFTQYCKNDDGSYSDLPKPNIDTGMGLERMASVMQDAVSIFDVDSIAAIRNKICEIAGVKYGYDEKKDVSIRIITDHARAITFMASDGILPANEGRGYVFKRLLRRAARHGKLLGIDSPFLTDVCQAAADVSKGAYPELAEKQEYIRKVISLEESRFHETLDQGMEILRQFIAETSGAVLSGALAFKLYDTFGFPPELVEEILSEHGLTYDKDAFLKNMDEQKRRARAAREESSYMGAEATVYDEIHGGKITEFVGYSDSEADSAIIALVVNGALAETAREGDEASVLLEVTPFYAESGGQAGDRGLIIAPNGEIEVSNCVKVTGGRFAHIGVVTRGEISVSDMVRAKIDVKNRASTARNHSATHLLHKALKITLGSHVEQAGSHVTADRLRFDFSHFQPMSKDELASVEREINDKILESLAVETEETSAERARQEGATALFGEKYGDIVRVVTMGDGYSKEL